jgi:hypothetical protein
MKSMTDWTPDELARIGDADELDISSYRPNGSLRPFVTTWVVRVDDTLYVRSAGPEQRLVPARRYGGYRPHPRRWRGERRPVRGPAARPRPDR